MKLNYLLVALVLTCSPAITRAAVSPEKRVEIDRMLKLTGMEKLIDGLMKQMIDGSRAQMPDVPSEFWDRFSREVHGNELIEMIVPLYDKYYSIEDLRAVNAFYSSPAGQRVLSTLPQIMKESMVLGQQWGEKMGQRIAEEARAEVAAKKAKAESEKSAH